MSLLSFKNTYTTGWIWAVLAVVLTGIVLVLYHFITFVAESRAQAADEEEGSQLRMHEARICWGDITAYIRCYVPTLAGTGWFGK